MADGQTYTHARRCGHFSSRFLTAQALSKRVVAGDTAAFAEMFRRYQDEICRYCFSIVGSREDAGDALQNTMVTALKSLPGEERELNLKPWLFRVAHNQSVDLVRAKRPMDEISEHESQSPSGVESEVVARERLRVMLTDMGQLSERGRAALVMRELNGPSLEEIGIAIEVNSAAAKQSVYEARCALREQAKRHEMDCEVVRQKISKRAGCAWPAAI